MKFQLPKIYPITDTRLSGLTHVEQVERLIAGGAEIVQLRDKHAPPREFYKAAVVAVELGKRHGVPIIINDRVDIALATGAAGVHLGQDDMYPAAAREILGRDAIIGCSTHNIGQAIAAAAMPIDLIAIGPVFTTSTKANPHEIVGLDGIAAVRRAIGTMQLVAIGGIGAADLPQVLNAGADSAAMIAAILSEPNAVTERMRELSEIASN